MRDLDVVSFGEALVDLLPEGRGRLRDCERFSVHSGGAPANVAVGLARLGSRVAFAGVVGDERDLLAAGQLRDDVLAIDPLVSIAKIPPRRLMVGHGTEDIEIPHSDARDLVAAADGRAELRLIQGAGHQLRADPRMVATLLGWLDRHR